MIDLSREISIIEAQVGDPKMGIGKTKWEHKSWKANALKAKAHMVSEHRLLKLWVKNERGRLREKLLSIDGLNDPKDPYCMLAKLHEVTMNILKTLDATVVVTDEQWRVIDQSRKLALGE
jgi:hypothetical protein